MAVQPNMSIPASPPGEAENAGISGFAFFCRRTATESRYHCHVCLICRRPLFLLPTCWSRTQEAEGKSGFSLCVSYDDEMVHFSESCTATQHDTLTTSKLLVKNKTSQIKTKVVMLPWLAAGGYDDFLPPSQLSPPGPPSLTSSGKNTPSVFGNRKRTFHRQRLVDTAGFFFPISFQDSLLASQSLKSFQDQILLPRGLRDRGIWANGGRGGRWPPAAGSAPAFCLVQNGTGAGTERGNKMRGRGGGHFLHCFSGTVQRSKGGGGLCFSLVAG
ncbi:hypothetical protein QBC39DRAFT_57844 [Podospora conica]|nr:hypothetical protein QBC39DRAFT_57844 [Schizothecium conicum]